MANINIRSSECAWKHAELSILGRVIKGLRGFEFKKTVEKEPIYGSGQHALDIQEGNIQCEGNIKLLGFELDALNRAALLAGFSDITEVPHEAVILQASFKKNASDPKTTVQAMGVSFTELAHAMEQNAKMREVTLPFVAMDIITL